MQRTRAIAGGLLGAVTLVGGLTWFLMTLGGPNWLQDAGVGLLIAAGGLVLLMPHRLRLPGVMTSAVAAGTAVAGTLAGLLAGATQVCCAFVYAMSRGWPFHWLQRGAVADDAATAERLALGSDWQVDAVALTGNVLFWSYVGMLVMALLVQRQKQKEKPEPLPVES